METVHDDIEQLQQKGSVDKVKPIYEERDSDQAPIDFRSN